MERFFERISFDQFKKDIKDDKKLYDEYLLPKRSTRLSAGYDFFAIEAFTLKPGETIKIPTGYKAKYKEDEMLMLVVRSSMGFKYNVRMCNQVGIIDSDYYNNENNEGHMFVALQNHGTKDFIVEKNQAYAQGIFSKYLVTDDDEVNNTREGGFGSTTKEK